MDTDKTTRVVRVASFSQDSDDIKRMGRVMKILEGKTYLNFKVFANNDKETYGYILNVSTDYQDTNENEIKNIVMSLLSQAL